jgi:transcriptional regulator with XRE-family HTH domain
MKKYSFTQRFMATLLGYSQSTISRTVNGHRKVPSHLHWNIAAVNEITAELSLKLSSEEMQEWLQNQPIDLMGRACTTGELVREENYGALVLAARAFIAMDSEPEGLPI